MTRDASPAAGARAAHGALPLERKLPLLILAILTLVLATSLGISFYEARQSAQISAGDRLTHLSRALASLLQQQTAARFTNMHRVAADTAVVNAFVTPTRAPSPAAKRAMLAITTIGDSLTPPMLWTADGRIIGTVRLEQSSDMDRFRTSLPAAGRTMSDTEQISPLADINGHAAMWQSVPVRKEGKLLGFLAQERRFTASPRTLQPFRDLIGAGIEFHIRNPEGVVWTSLSGVIVPPPTRTVRFGDSLQVLTMNGRDVLASSTVVQGYP
ncbi:MAG: hypothetical protein ACREPM_20620, partial [Gemmatimonadaceae bacterium]